MLLSSRFLPHAVRIAFDPARVVALESNGVRCCQVAQGPHDAGGLLPFRRQASMCEAWGLNVNLHAFMQSEISFLAHAQVASTVPNLTKGNQAMHQLLAERLTSGVDVETLRALEDALLEFAGSVMVISHDRWFLDRIATHILAFEGNSQVTFFDGNYQEYEADKKKRLGEEGAKPKRIRYKPLTV